MIKLIIKLVILQLYWFFAVYFGPRINDLYIVIVTAIITLGNYPIYRPKIELKNYLALTALFSLYGVIQDGGLFYFGITDFAEGYYPFWINGLYLVFIAYYGDLFNYLDRLSKWGLSLLGGVGGSLAYFGGHKLESIAVTNELLFLSVVFLSWAIFFPLSFHLFYRRFS